MDSVDGDVVIVVWMRVGLVVVIPVAVVWWIVMIGMRVEVVMVRVMMMMVCKEGMKVGGGRSRGDDRNTLKG